MSDKPVVIVDPNFRKMGEIFSPTDLTLLHQKFEVIWGKDEQMPLKAFREALPQASAVVCADWRYGNELLADASNLRGILTVSGGFPRSLDFDVCYERSIRVLS